MRRLLAIIAILVVLVVAGSLVAGYSSATVTNHTTMKVEATGNAQLAFRCVGGVGNQDPVCNAAGGELHLNFENMTAPFFPGPHGFQPHSEYVWDWLFDISNITSEKIEIWMENKPLPYMDVGLGRCPGQWWCQPTVDANLEYFVKDGGLTTGNKLTLAPGNSVSIAVRFQVPHGAGLGSWSDELVVHSKAIP